MRISRHFLFTFTLICVSFTASKLFASDFDIVAQAPIKQLAFTQGYVLENDQFYVSSGQYGKSFIARQDKTGAALNTIKLPTHLFAEGLTYFQGAVYFITWRERTAFKLDPTSLKTIARFSYKGEGWGLTHDDVELIMSNGSNQLQFFDPETFERTRKLHVNHENYPLQKINELEYAHGSIWANVWHSNNVYRIDPSNGHVLQSWDLSILVKQQSLTDPGSVLNGLAFSKADNAFWVTGKNWNNRYLIRFKSTNNQP